MSRIYMRFMLMSWALAVYVNMSLRWGLRCILEICIYIFQSWALLFVINLFWVFYLACVECFLVREDDVWDVQLSCLGSLVDSVPVVRPIPCRGFYCRNYWDVTVLSDSAMVVAISVCGRIPVFAITNFCKISLLISLGEEDLVLVRKRKSWLRSI